jgi:hypothetical protein
VIFVLMDIFSSVAKEMKLRLVVEFSNDEPRVRFTAGSVILIYLFAPGCLAIDLPFYL